MVFELFGEHLEDVDLDSIDIRSDLEIVSKELSVVVKNFEQEKNQNDFDGNEQNLEIPGTKQEDTNPYCEIKVNQEFDELLKHLGTLRQLIESLVVLTCFGLTNFFIFFVF